MLKAEFKIDQPEQVLETPICVRFVCRNAGPHSLSFVIGNGREDGFRFRAEPEAKAHNPYFEFGGLMPVVKVAPEQERSQEILLNRYLQFGAPGKYVVHGEIDLEINDAETRDVRIHRVRGALSVLVREDEEQRDDVLATLEADLTGSDGSRQMRAADALAELRTASALPILARGLESKNSAVVEKMIKGISRTGGDEARELLFNYKLTEPPQPLLLLAHQELTKLGGPLPRLKP